MADFFSTGMGTVGNFLTTQYNNKQAAEREKNARRENYMYNELSAKSADQRTRSLYNDLYSPDAQMRQLKAAGLSPSIYASGGMTGKSGVSGAQGSGANGISPQVFGADPIGAAMQMAQIGLIKAQTNNVNEDTIKTEIENGIRKLNANKFTNEWKLLNTTWYGNENGVLSWSDLANNSENYEQFQSKIFEILKDTDTPIALYVKTENGQKTLRNIYENNKTFGNEIAVLANSEANANLMLQITNLLNTQGFANESANAQLKQLRQISESAELTSEQKGAMNRLIDKMGQSTTKDIILTLLMAIGQYSHANLNFGVSQTNQIKK